MFYRVDYIIGCMFLGASIGALLSKRTLRFESHDIARVFYALTAFRAVLGAVAVICSLVFSKQHFWNRISSGLGDFGNLIFGAIFGLALVRSKPLELLRESAVYSALCLSVALAFVGAGLAKAFYLDGMITFFTHSGYSTALLRFIIGIEVFGGAALLLSWATLPVIFGLTIDMIGAVYTHVHNGDPLNDSTGAIAMLIRIIAILALWALGKNSVSRHEIRRRLLGVGLGFACCFVAAVAGSAMLRRPAAPYAQLISSRSRIIEQVELWDEGFRLPDDRFYRRSSQRQPLAAGGLTFIRTKFPWLASKIEREETCRAPGSELRSWQL